MASLLSSINNNVNTQSKRPPAATELHRDTELDFPETCVICLDRIGEKARALPCNHDQFDFPCLGTWLQQQRVCPLCKAPVQAIRYDDAGTRGRSKTFHLPPPEVPHTTSQQVSRRRGRTSRYPRYNHDQRTSHGNRDRGAPTDSESAIQIRRRVYRNKTPSLHVGTNRISQYQNVVPSSFQTNAHLVARAKAFIRRELSVFDFLNPTSASFGSTDRRASNAEFLLEYIISILKSIDLKGSTGQAEELLKDFLGRDYARLFLHELEAWLRSPYERLENWDCHVQYADSPIVSNHE